MIVFLLLLAQAPAPTPSPTPAPTARPAPLLGRSGPAARPKTLSEHAAEMKAKGTPAGRVSFEDLPSVEGDSPETESEPGARSGTKGAPKPDDGAAEAAQRRMDRAVERGLEVPERTRSPRRARARKEWDDAAESCRQTPGCVPVYRDDPRWGDKKPLRTDAELIEEIRKRGFSEPHPIRK